MEIRTTNGRWKRIGEVLADMGLCAGIGGEQPNPREGKADRSPSRPGGQTRLVGSEHRSAPNDRGKCPEHLPDEEYAAPRCDREANDGGGALLEGHAASNSMTMMERSARGSLRI